jgi:3-hydroxyisobutyrate dehydrogenase
MKRNLKVGFIGLGIMGKPMAQNLLKAGFELTVFNRSKPPVDLLVSSGAAAADSPKAVAERSGVVITMVTDSEAVKSVVLGQGGVIEGAHEGLVLIDMSTIAPGVTRSVAASLASKGVCALDAPVSGGDVGAREATLTIMVGGASSDFEACLPILKALGKKVVYMGPTGSGQLTKLANQILVACNMIGVSECLNFAKSAGLDLDKLIDSLSAGAASSWSLVNLGPKVAKRDFAPGFKVKLLQKDLRYVLSAADELDAPLPATSLVHSLYTQLEEKGLGDAGTQALVTALEQLTGQLRNP